MTPKDLEDGDKFRWEDRTYYLFKLIGPNQPERLYAKQVGHADDCLLIGATPKLTMKGWVPGEDSPIVKVEH